METDIDVVKVPGAFEIPMLAQRIAARQKYDAVDLPRGRHPGGYPPF
jgi:6,7-dimethyl-8-ribityllumazine synthase